MKQPYQEVLEQKKFELFLDRYWINCFERGYKESKERIMFLDGYKYCCRYIIGKNGKIFQKDDDYFAGCFFEFVRIKSKLRFPKLCYRLNIKRNEQLYVEQLDFDMDFDTMVENDIQDSLVEIMKGEYVLAE